MFAITREAFVVTAVPRLTTRQLFSLLTIVASAGEDTVAEAIL